uniref:RING-type domain-containing protein n=1 Tax=Tetradesmus obliquus TaxID=3088 RepID=A0A383VQS5_TETOB|eukprot:jgi/Sobl393_1/3858/SZX67857.1
MQTDNSARERLLSAHTGFFSGKKTILHVAAKTGKADVVASVLGPLVDAVTAEIVDGVYPGKAAELLGRTVNQQDSKGRTPLLTACHHGHWDCAEQLLEAASNIFACDKDGNSVLHLAAVGGHAALLEQLLAKAEAQAVTARLAGIVNLSGFSPLHYAAFAGNAACVRQLLAAGVDQLQSSWGEYDRWLVVPPGSTPLHVAAAAHHAGCCLLLLQSYALQLREWLPGEAVPVDPRGRADFRGELPLQLALHSGLPAASQLALCLQPHINILSLFSPQQLDELRQRGPPSLRVLAAAALRGHLLQQLAQQQLLQQEVAMQQQLMQQHQQVRRQQQQRQLAPAGDAGAGSSVAAAAGITDNSVSENNNSSGNSWQRWWRVRTSIDGAAETNKSPAYFGSSAVGAASAAAHNSSFRAQFLKVEDDAGSDSSSRHHSELLQGLHRTPSITLGAMQYAQHASDVEEIAAESRSRGKQGADRPRQAAAAASGQFSSTDAAWHLLAPAGDADHAAAAVAATAPSSATAAAAASSSAAAGASPSPGSSRQLESASSITLGCLDRVWQCKPEEQQQQQQQQQQQPLKQQLHGGNTDKVARQHAAPPPTEAEAGWLSEIEVMQPAQQQQQLQLVSKAEHAASAVEVAAGNVAAPTQLPAASCNSSSSSSPSSSDNSSGMDSKVHHAPGSAGPADAAAASLQTYQHINEHIHRATGDTNGFALMSSPPAVAVAVAAAAAADNACEVQANSSSSSSSSGVCDVAHSDQHTAGKRQQQQWQQLPLLQASSITLAELMRRSDEKAGSSSSCGRRAADASANAIGTAGHRLAASLAAVKAAPMRRKSHRLLNRPPSPQQVLATAGVKGGSCRDWEQLLTPLSWKLYQQQRDAAKSKQAQQQQQIGVGGLSEDVSLKSSQSAAIGSSLAAASSPFANSARSSTAAASSVGSSSSNGAAAAAAMNARSARLACLAAGGRSPHRRSFELPGSAAGGQMSAVFGASKQHVSRMLREAGSIDPRGLYRMMSKGQGRLAVATSLAGALPGCVSEKLVQFVDVSSSMAGLGAAAATGGSGYGATASGRTSVSVSGSADGVGVAVAGSCGSTEGEVCAVCADKLPDVALAGCGHSLCFDCTRTIVGEGVGSRPPLCPFCRRAITGFSVLVPAAACV